MKLIAGLGTPFSNALRGAAKVRSLVPIYGAMGTVKLILKNILWFERMYRVETVLDLPEDAIQPEMPLKINVEGKLLDLSAWHGRQEILDIRGPYGLMQFGERLQRGDLLMTAYWDEKFVGFVWLEFPPVQGAGYPLEEHEAYIFDVWTFSAYRGKRVLPVLLQASKDYLRERNPEIKTLVAHIADWNKPSMIGFTRAGYKIVGDDLSLVFLGYHRKIRMRRPH